MVFCKNCGYDISTQNFNFCPKCGKSNTLQNKEIPSTTQPSTMDRDDKKAELLTRGLLIIIGIIITLFFMILIGYAYAYLDNYVEESVHICNLAIELSNPGLAQQCNARQSGASMIMVGVIILVIPMLIGIYITLKAIRLKLH